MEQNKTGLIIFRPQRVRERWGYLSPWLYAVTLCGFLLGGLAGCRSQPEVLPWQWEAANAGLPHQAIFLTVAANPTNPRQLWAGIYATGGLATSHDGGQSWRTGAAGLADNPIFDLLPVVKNRQTILWAATRDGLRQSADAGASWQPATGLPQAVAFALSADTQGRLYVGLDSAGIYRQSGDDDNWQALTSGAASQTVISLAVSPNGEQIYGGTSGQGVMASSDGGQSWVTTYPGRYAPNVALNPNKPAVAIASLRNRLVRTHDGGQSWHTLPVPWAADEIVSLLWLPDGRLGAGTGTGQIYYSLNSGQSWRPGRPEISGGGVMDLALVPTSTPQILAATWTGLYGSRDNGQSWSALAPTLGSPHPEALLSTENGLLLGTRTGLFRWQAETGRWQSIPARFPSGIAALAADPTNGQTLYAGTAAHGVYRSGDGGQSWQSLPSIVAGIPALAVSPTNPNHLHILAAWERAYSSYDGGQSWQARWQGLGDVLETTSLALDPLEPVTYVGTETGLYRSDDEAPWILVAWELVGHSILALMVQPLPETTPSRSIVYIGTTQGAYRSLDKGGLVEGPWRGHVRWGQGLQNLSVTAFLADATKPWHLLAGTAYAGVYESLDGGRHWQAIGPPEMSQAVVKSLAWGPAGQLFVAATNGVWQAERGPQ